MNRVAQLLQSRLLPLAVAGYLVVYFLLEVTGLFALRSESPVWIVYSNAFLAGACVAAFLLAFRLFQPLRGGPWARQMIRLGLVLILVGIGGLFWGRLGRFEGRIFLTEGQIFSGLAEEYAAGSLRAGELASPPRIETTVVKVIPEFSKDGADLASLTATAQFVFPERSEITGPVTLSKAPVFLRGNWIWLSSFGYSPYYRLIGEDGKMLDESFVYLRLFPPGSEDYFRLLMPHTFYLRYEPPSDAAETGESAPSDSGEYHLRIARNKAILVDTDVKPGESVAFDNASITFEPPRRWVEVVLVRDYGAILAVLTLLPGIAILGLSRVLVRRSSGGG